MIGRFGIIEPVLCNSPIRPIAPGCTYGLSGPYAQGFDPVSLTATTGLTPGTGEGDIAAQAGGFTIVDPRLRIKDPAEYQRRRQAGIDRYYKILAQRKFDAEDIVNGNGNGNAEDRAWGSIKYIIGGVVLLGVLGTGAFLFMRRKKGGKS